MKMKDSRQMRQLAATFIIGGVGVVLVQYAVQPAVEKRLRAKKR